MQVNIHYNLAESIMKALDERNSAVNLQKIFDNAGHNIYKCK